MVMTNSGLNDLLTHGGWLRGLASSLMRDTAAVDDVVQETYLAALRSPPEAGRPVRPWLKFVLTNVVRERFRKDRRRERREQFVFAPQGVSATDETAEQAEMQRALAEAVLTLPEPYRTAIVMRYYEQRSLVEIATAQQVPLSTLKTHLERGRDQLRERLDKQYGDRRAWCLLLGRLTLPKSTASTMALLLSKAAALALVAALLVVTGIWVTFQVSGGKGPLPPATGKVAVAATPASPETLEVREVAASLKTNTRDGAKESSWPPRYILGSILAEEDGTGAAGSEATFFFRTGPESGLCGVRRTDTSGAFRVDLEPMDQAAYRASWLNRYHYSIPDGLVVRSGSHAPLFRFPLFNSQSRPDLDSDGGVTLEPLTVRRGSLVSGRVESDSGAGLPGARLFVLTEDPFVDGELPTGL
ncbi:MAG: RNA polymerase sigma factor, partial [Planctomycetota bacterium]